MDNLTKVQLIKDNLGRAINSIINTDEIDLKFDDLTDEYLDLEFTKPFEQWEVRACQRMALLEIIATN